MQTIHLSSLKAGKPKSFFKNLIFAILLIIVVPYGCKDNDTDYTGGSLKIGLLIPITGSAASTGESTQAAADLAIHDINNYLPTTGSGLTLEYVIKDTGTDPGKALEGLKELDAEGIQYVVGPYASASAEAVVDYANQHGIILLSPSSVASSLAIAGDNLFRLVPSDGNQAVAVSALFDHDSIETVIPVVRDDVWGDGLIADVTQVLTQQGKTVITPIRYDPSSINTTDIVTQLAASVNMAIQNTPASRTGIYMLSFGEGTTILSAAAQEPDCALVKWYGSSAYANNASLPSDNTAPAFALLQKLLCPAFAPDPSAADLWEPVAQQLTNQLGRTPEVYALTTYDSFWLLSKVYQECADPANSQSFKAALVKVAENYFGITGRTTFDQYGDRKYASFEFWGIALSGNDYLWKAYGHFNNSNGQLVIY